MDARWSRLVAEHRRNAARLDRERPDPPPWWGVPVGFVVPLVPLGIAVVSLPAVLSVALWFVVLIPLAGLACLWVQRWQTVTVGLVIGVLTAALAVQWLEVLSRHG